MRKKNIHVLKDMAKYGNSRIYVKIEISFDSAQKILIFLTDYSVYLAFNVKCTVTICFG